MNQKLLIFKSNSLQKEQTITPIKPLPWCNELEYDQ